MNATRQCKASCESVHRVLLAPRYPCCDIGANPAVIMRSLCCDNGCRDNALSLRYPCCYNDCCDHALSLCYPCCDNGGLAQLAAKDAIRDARRMRVPATR